MADRKILVETEALGVRLRLVRDEKGMAVHGFSDLWLAQQLSPDGFYEWHRLGQINEAVVDALTERFAAAARVLVQEINTLAAKTSGCQRCKHPKAAHAASGQCRDVSCHCRDYRSVGLVMETPGLEDALKVLDAAGVDTGGMRTRRLSQWSCDLCGRRLPSDQSRCAESAGPGLVCGGAAVRVQS